MMWLLVLIAKNFNGSSHSVHPDDEIKIDYFILNTSEEKIAMKAPKDGNCHWLDVFEYGDDNIFVDNVGCSSEDGADIYTSSGKLIASGESHNVGYYKTYDISDGYVYYADNYGVNYADFEYEYIIPTYRKLDFKGNVVASYKMPFKCLIKWAVGDYFVYKYNNNFYIGDINGTINIQLPMEFDYVSSTKDVSGFRDKNGIVFSYGSENVKLFNFDTKKLEDIA